MTSHGRGFEVPRFIAIRGMARCNAGLGLEGIPFRELVKLGKAEKRAVRSILHSQHMLSSVVQQAHLIEAPVPDNLRIVEEESGPVLYEIVPPNDEEARRQQVIKALSYYAYGHER